MAEVKKRGRISFYFHQNLQCISLFLAHIEYQGHLVGLPSTSPVEQGVGSNRLFGWFQFLCCQGFPCCDEREPIWLNQIGKLLVVCATFTILIGFTIGLMHRLTPLRFTFSSSSFRTSHIPPSTPYAPHVGKGSRSFVRWR